MGKPPVLNPQVRFKLSVPPPLSHSGSLGSLDDSSVSPALTLCRTYTPTISEEQKAEGVRQLKMYHDWFYENIMSPASEDGYSSSILVLPWTNGEPDYRDKYRDGPQQFTGQGFFFYNIGPYAQCPELIFPGELRVPFIP